VKLEGTLDAFSLPDVFGLLSATKKTGALHLAVGEQHGIVHFASGAISGALADVQRRALLRRLVGAGMVGVDSLEAAAGPDGDSAGLVIRLRDSGALDEAELLDVASEQAHDAVFDLMRWPEGAFSFVVDEPNPEDIGLQLDADDVVTEVRRRLEAWSGAAETVPSPACVPAMPLNPPSSLQISPDEWTLLALVDGHRSAADIVALAGRGEYAVVTALAGLVARGLLVISDSSANGHAGALHAAHAALARLEGTAAPEVEVAGSTGSPAATAGPAMPEQVRSLGAPTGYPGVPSQEPRSPRPAPVGSAVVPPRQEPFLPRRRPDHPEAMPASVAARRGLHADVGSVEGTAAVAPNPSLIERDPSINKSLLLRLIAGVQGL
jgi:hypothetical protein